MISSFSNRSADVNLDRAEGRIYLFYLGLGFWFIALIIWCIYYSWWVLVPAGLSLFSFLFYSFYRDLINMFGKNKVAVEGAQMNVEPVSQFLENKQPDDESVNSTVLASGVCFTGNITAANNVYIHGEIIGNVEAKDAMVKVINNGSVQGDILCRELIIDGTVLGECKAETINIYEHGNVKGSLSYISLSVKKGGIFTGNAEMMKGKDKKNQEKEEQHDKVAAFPKINNSVTERKDVNSSGRKNNSRT